MKRSIPVIFSLAIAACASNGSEPAQPVPEQVSGPAPSSVPAPAPGVSSSEQEMIARTETTADSGGIEALDPPDVERLPADMVPNRPGTEDAIVCERVVPTGSVLPRKVCRHQSEIDQRSLEDQRTFDNIKSNTANAASRL